LVLRDLAPESEAEKCAFPWTQSDKKWTRKSNTFAGGPIQGGRVYTKHKRPPRKWNSFRLDRPLRCLFCRTPLPRALSTLSQSLDIRCARDDSSSQRVCRSALRAHGGSTQGDGAIRASSSRTSSRPVWWSGVFQSRGFSGKLCYQITPTRDAETLPYRHYNVLEVGEIR
jgi:hypothetical protein